MNILKQVEKKLAGRLQAGMQAWTAALQGQRQKDEDIDIPMDTDTPDKPTHKPGGDPKVRVLKSYSVSGERT